jgi:hypothetical protein
MLGSKYRLWSLASLASQCHFCCRGEGSFSFFFVLGFVGFLNVERGANESGWRVIFVSREIGFWRAG